MISPIDVWNFFSQCIDPIYLASMPKCHRLPGYLSCFSVERRACDLAYSLLLPFLTMSSALSYRWVDLRTERFIMQRQYYFVVLVP